MGVWDEDQGEVEGLQVGFQGSQVGFGGWI